jgi:hypothetical protein
LDRVRVERDRAIAGIGPAPPRRSAAGDMTFGVPVILSGVPLIGAGHWNTQYDVSPDGSRVYFWIARCRSGPLRSMSCWG